MKTQPNDTINPIVSNDQSAIIEYGLTKREYFAAMALQGILSSGRVMVVDHNLGELSVKQADALINALNETK